MLLSRDLWREADLRMSGGVRGAVVSVEDGERRERREAAEREMRRRCALARRDQGITYQILIGVRRLPTAAARLLGPLRCELVVLAPSLRLLQAHSVPAPAAYLSLLPSSGQRARTGSLQLIASAQGGGGRAGA